MYTLHGRQAHDNVGGYDDIVDESGRKVGEIADSNKELPATIDPDQHFQEGGLIEGDIIVPSDDDAKPIFICGMCDMVVGEDDRECRFCGAEFEEGSQEDSNEAEGLRGALVQRCDDPRSNQSFTCSAEKVDVLSMMIENRAKLGPEHIGGAGSCTFLTYSRILRGIEDAMAEAGEFGAETEEARGILLNAWNACHEGRWAYASQLAEESKKKLVANASGLIRGHILCLREAMVEMKRRGRSVTPFVIEIKTIQKALAELRLEDAIRMTKEMMAEIKSMQMHILESMDGGEQDAEKIESFHGQGI